MDTIILITLTPSEWIGISNIITTALLGVWIGFGVKKNLTTNRAVKEYFICETREIKIKYNQFINDLYSSKISPEQIKEWLKVMTIKINTYEGFIQNEYKIKPDISSIHNYVKYFITDTDDFNFQYKNAKILFSAKSKNDILGLHTDLSNNLTKMIIDINRANRKYYCKNKYGQKATMHNDK